MKVISSDYLARGLLSTSRRTIKVVMLNLLSWVSPRIIRYSIRILNQSIGFGFDSGIKNEVAQFSREVEKFNLINPVVLDVGANIGNWSNEFNSLVRGSINYAFEPSKETFLSLAETTKNSSNIHVYNIGVGKENDIHELHYDEAKSGMVSLSKRNLKHFGITFNQSEKVKIVRLDSFLAEVSLRPDFLKIDVEGHELSVLEGLGDYINDLKLTQFEFGGTDIDSRIFFQDFWNFFEVKQFDLFRLTPRGTIRVNSYMRVMKFFLSQLILQSLKECGRERQRALPCFS